MRIYHAGQRHRTGSHATCITVRLSRLLMSKGASHREAGMSHAGEEQGNHQQTDPSRTKGPADPVGNDATDETVRRWKVPHLTPIVTLAAIWAIVFGVLLAWGLDA